MRPPRGEEPGAIHHVVAQGVGRRRIVHDDIDRRSLSRRLHSVADDLEWVVHAWCLLGTHLHAVVETPFPNLGDGMRRIKGGYAYAFNRRHGTESHLFAQRYWSRRVKDEAHMFTACVYVVVNPVAAGLCRHPRDWAWSSFHRTVGGSDEAFSSGEDLLLRMFGDTPAEARRGYAAAVDAAARLAVERRTAQAELWHRIGLLTPGGGAPGARSTG